MPTAPSFTGGITHETKRFHSRRPATRAGCGHTARVRTSGGRPTATKKSIEKTRGSRRQPLRVWRLRSRLRVEARARQDPEPNNELPHARLWAAERWIGSADRPQVRWQTSRLRSHVPTPPSVIGLLNPLLSYSPRQELSRRRRREPAALASSPRSRAGGLFQPWPTLLRTTGRKNADC